MPVKEDPDQELIKDKLQLLVSMQLLDQDEDTAEMFEEFLGSIQKKYDEAKAKSDAEIISDEEKKALEEAGIKTDKITEAERKKYKQICSAIAKGVPDIMKHSLAAIKAFQKGDVMNGTASVMDICAAAAPMIGGIISAFGGALALAGPIGMVVGAVFGIVGQLLAFFGPKQESMIDQIEKLMVRLQAKEKLREIKATHEAVHVFATTLQRSARRLNARSKDPGSKDGTGWQPSLLGKPVRTDADAEKLVIALQAFAIEAAALNLQEGNTIAHFWDIKEYLDDPENQDLDDWPEILAVWCKSYSDMMSAHLTYSGLCGSADLQAREEENEHPPPDSLVSRHWRNTLRMAITRVRAVDIVKRDQLWSCNERALKFLRGIKSVAQNRGTVAIFAPDRAMYLGTGRNMLRENKFAQVYQHCHNMALTPPRGSETNKNKPYDAWMMDYYSHGFQHAGVVGSKASLEPGQEIYLAAHAPERSEFDYATRGFELHFLDLTAVPAAGSSTQFIVYATVNQQTGGRVEGWSYDTGSGAFAFTGYKKYYGLRLTRIRAVAEPVQLADDPDRTSQAAEPVGTVPIIYAAVKDEARLFVIAGNSSKLESVPIPSTMSAYSGVAVDAGYVWVYGPQGFACATHASILRCLVQERPAPWWLGHGNDKNIAPVLDLSPCEDGTVLVSTPDKLVMSNYRVDLATPDIPDAQRLVIEDWKTLGAGGGSSKVQKVPIFCAPVLRSLMSDLAPKPPAALAAPTPVAAA